MYINLRSKIILKLMSKVEAIVLEGRNPHVVAPTFGMVSEDQDKGIMQLREDKDMQIQRAIQRGNLKLRELKNQVQLRKKIILMDVEIKELEKKIMLCRIDKLRMIGHDMGNHTTALEDFCREFVALLPWL